MHTFKQDDCIRLYEDQIESLARAKHSASHTIFCQLLFLVKYYADRSGVTRLDNSELAQLGVSRSAKSRAISELEGLGLIEVRRNGRKPYGIVVR